MGSHNFCHNTADRGGTSHFIDKISPDSIVVEAKNGKTFEVAIVPATVFLKDDKPAKLQDLTLGDRVVIHATPKGLALEADEVRFAPAPPKTKPKS